MVPDLITDPTKVLLWVDLETTGLDPSDDFVLELGLMVTDLFLDPICHSSWVIRPSISSAKIAMDSLRDRMNPQVLDMHTKNRLLDEVEQQGIHTSEAEAAAVAWLDSVGYTESVSPMCGSTVSFDRSFLALDMPELHDRWTYRHLDVSSFKEAAQRWAPAVYDSLPVPAKRHRVLPDLLDSVNEMKHYFDHFVITGVPYGDE